MGSPSAQPAALSKTVDLQTLVSAIQNAVQAQNGIATAIKALTSAFTTFNTNFLAAFPVPLYATATWDPASVATGGQTSTTITVTGAALGNYVEVSFSLDVQGMSLTGYVSSANTVTAVLANNTAAPIDLASGTVKARVTAV
jgi:hypothetical protein